MTEIYTNPPRSEILALRKKSVGNKQEELITEATAGKPWPIYKSPAERYWRAFSRLFEALPFPQILREAEERGIKPLVFDVFSDGEAVRTMEGTHGGLALTLVDFRKQEEKDRDTLDNLTVIGGDIHDFETVRKIQQFLRDKQMKGFPLIVSRPHAGWKWIGKSPKMVHLIVNRLYSFLEPDGGILYIELPVFSEGWATDLKNAGFKVSGVDKLLMLQRSPNNPSRLPIGKMSGQSDSGIILQKILDIIGKDRQDKVRIPRTAQLGLYGRLLDIDNKLTYSSLGLNTEIIRGSS